MATNDWSIVAGERPINVGFLDRVILHGQTSHSFVRLKNDKGETLAEFHGRETNKLGAWLNTACVLCTHHTNDHAFLQVLSFVSKESMDAAAKNVPTVETDEIVGSKDTILRDFECMARAAKVVDRARINYYLIDRNLCGQNCHAFLGECFDRVGVVLKNGDLSFKTPGIENDLERWIPELTKIKVNLEAPLQEIETSLLNMLTPYSARPDISLQWLACDCERPTSPSLVASAPTPTIH